MGYAKKPDSAERAGLRQGADLGEKRQTGYRNWVLRRRR